jgi:hypothetical protein
MEFHLANRWKYGQTFALSGLDALVDPATPLTGATMHRFGIRLSASAPVKIWISLPEGIKLIPRRSVVMTDLVELYFIQPEEQDAAGDSGPRISHFETDARSSSAGTAAGSSDTTDMEAAELVGPFDDQVPAEQRFEQELGLPGSEKAGRDDGLRSGTFRIVFADEHTILFSADDFLGTQATFHVASRAFGSSEVKVGSQLLSTGQDTFSLHLERGLLRSTLTVVHAPEGRSDMLEAAVEKCYDLESKVRRRLRPVSPSPCPPHVPEFLQPAYHKALSLLRCCVRRPLGRLTGLWPAPCRRRDEFTVPEAVAALLAWRFLDKHLALEMLQGLLAQVDAEGRMPLRLSSEPAEEAPLPAPPMLAFIAYHVGHEIGNRSVIEQSFDPIQRNLAWMRENLRSPDEELLAWHSPAASLEPASPRFDDAAELIPVDLNGLFIAELRYLAGIAKAVGKVPEYYHLREEADRRAERLCQQLYNSEEGFFFDEQPDGNLLHIKCASALMPLFARAVQPPVAERLLTHATSADEFRLKFPVATVARDARDFAPAPDRGAVNPLINYFVIHGLSRYGYKTIADNFTNVTLAVLAEGYDTSGCFWPFYDAQRKRRPKDLTEAPDRPVNVPDYAPTAAVFLSLCHEYYGRSE